jgi:hypothetical protein
LEYPVSFEADYVEPRSRLTSFFRLLLALPVVIWVGIYGIAAFFVWIAAWFAIVFTGRYPEGMYRFLADFITIEVTATSYQALLTDPYPPFTAGSKPDYPVRMYFAGPLPRYSRLKTFFRGLLAIPIYIMRYVASIMLNVCAFAAWIMCVFTARLPRGLFDPMVLASSYIARSDAYLFLLTETYPPFQDSQTRTAGIEGGEHLVPGFEQAAPEFEQPAPKFDS